MPYKLLLSIILSLMLTEASAQRDTLFWFVAPEVTVSNLNFDRPIRFFITSYNKPATVTISQPAGGGMSTQTTILTANTSVSVDLTPWINAIENKPYDVILNQGIKIHSTAPITVYYEVVSSQCMCNPEVFSLKGTNALGTEFYIPNHSRGNFVDPFNIPTPYNTFDIVSTDNNTTVDITPTQDIVGHNKNTTFSIKLNAGQTYSARAAGTSGGLHLVGSRITSDKPIAVTEKDDQLGSFTSADLTGDQLVPVDKLGKEYIAIVGNLDTPFHKAPQVVVVATQNNTVVNGSAMLNAGQSIEIKAPGEATYIYASKPIYAYQLSGFRGELGCALLPSLACTGSTKVSVARSTNDSVLLLLTVRSGGQGNFLVNGIPGIITAAQFKPVANTGGLWYAGKALVPNTIVPQNSTITVTNSTHLFHMGMLSKYSTTGASFGYFSNYGVLQPDITAADSLCAGETIKLSTDSIAGAIYYWTGPAGFSSLLRNPSIPNATNAMSGVYTLQVSADTCNATTSVTIKVNNRPNVSILQGDTTICNGPITLMATGATSYTWSPATGLNTTFGPTVAASPPSNMTYTVKGKEQHGCENTDAVTIKLHPAASITVTPQQDTICSGETASLTSSGGVAYSWLSTSGFTGSFADKITVSPTATTNYIVEGTDTTGCIDVDTAIIYVGNGYNETVNLSLCNDTTIYLGELAISEAGSYQHKMKTILGCDSVINLDLSYKQHTTAGFTYTPEAPVLNEPTIFHNTSVNAVSHYWNFGDNGSSTEKNTVHMFAKSGMYQVCLTTISADLCEDKICKDVGAEVYCVVDVPTAFSPNGDGKNDILYVRGGAVEELHLRIYNRWGQLIFETESFERGWDGTFNGEKVNVDVVAYVLHAKFINGNTYSKSGNITVLK